MNFDPHFHFSGATFKKRLISSKRLAACFSDFFSHLPSLSYSWDTSRLHHSASSVCIPVELYLKAWSLHWLEECTSVVRPHPSVSVIFFFFCLYLCLLLHYSKYLFLIEFSRALAFAIDLELELIADINIQQQRAGWRLILFITSTSAFSGHDFNASFILCQVSSRAWFSELEPKHVNESQWKYFFFTFITLFYYI